jgi:hypothetical protein
LTLPSAASGAIYGLFLFQLKSGDEFYYALGPFDNDSATAFFVQLPEVWQNPQGLVGYTGEFFNFVERWRITDKFPDGDLAGWLASH